MRSAAAVDCIGKLGSFLGRYCIFRRLWSLRIGYNKTEEFLGFYSKLEGKNTNRLEAGQSPTNSTISSIGWPQNTSSLISTSNSRPLQKGTQCDGIDRNKQNTYEEPSNLSEKVSRRASELSDSSHVWSNKKEGCKVLFFFILLNILRT